MNRIISKDIDENIRIIEELTKDCGDVVKRKFPIGKERSVYGFIIYIDVMIDRRVIEESILEKLMVDVRGVDPEIKDSPFSVYDLIKDGGLATADIKELITIEEVMLAILSGDTVLLIDGFSKAIMIATKGFPNRGVQEPDTESVVRGSKDGFSEALRINTVLIRRRIRDTALKIKQKQIGVRSKTDIALVYMEGIVKPELLKEVEDRLASFEIDAILESGTIEQLIEDKWTSPFPQIQSTQRPDKVAASVLEGRVAIVVDNTPFVLIVPAPLNCFLQASEDYYQRWIVTCFVRIIRYISAIIALSLPGLYIALTSFHPEMIPTSLTLAIAASREGVPFPAVFEILIMEIAFELLREAGIRLPKPIGSTIGIVGGLIIGQAAVEANIISPIIVIVVSLTAISSFTIPSIALTEGMRICKFLIIMSSAVLGLYGFILGELVILIHLVSLKSFGTPYLTPYVGSEQNGGSDLKDSLIRMPLFMLNRRPMFSEKGNRTRLRIFRNKQKMK